MPSVVELRVQRGPVCLTQEPFASGRPTSYKSGKVAQRPPPLWLPLPLLASCWWASQPQSRTQAEGIPPEQANPRVKAAFCTNLSGFQGLGFCFVSALWKCLLTLESAKTPRWARNPCADGGHLCPQKAGWGSLRGSRGTDITAHLPGGRSSALSVAQPLL